MLYVQTLDNIIIINMFCMKQIIRKDVPYGSTAEIVTWALSGATIIYLFPLILRSEPLMLVNGEILHAI